MKELDFLQDKRITILGLGATGMSCARYLERQQIPFAVMDSRSCVPAFAEVNALEQCQGVHLGGWDSDVIASSDVIIASPGVDVQQPQIHDAVAASAELIGDVELFIRVNNKPVVALTGSNGKSTVVSLIAHLAKACNINSILAGNIGVPVLDTVDDSADIVILELSSFQLEIMSSMRAEVGGILNICDDHLDRHKTMTNYQAIKQRIYGMSKSFVFNREDVLTYPENAKAQAISFGLQQGKTGHFGLVTTDKTYISFGDQSLIAADELPVAGQHNLLNCMAALAYGQLLGWPMAQMLAGLKTFSGLEHRCQRIESSDGVAWVNDSKATNVGATLAAIDGLAPTTNKLVLIAGGDGKGADFSPLEAALNDRVDTLITLGQDRHALANLKANTSVVDSMMEAVRVAKSEAQPGDMVLLSPACASIDMYPNYMARGEDFRRCIEEVLND
ncbi:UDP-N-acetylmuramoyl-L-alanine--D-glutamate ligase [Thalassotalea sp. PS06]|uniref:UDP-N-acetylmuramoyl-L-alanine--D-glutamate ligase n=1 Tax=Thalassotalea sp. PS06 TaxID=2594005 RepID=UPI001165077B|nr:UDP-N-acetylmuramoyl-L-alanine--D-glutamate ligase [Thalassotalea sp. PS06]QDP00343.1 UDP-N-acetylmuramoyl-L-alanine--D-glutamate ligase [Thalassotalea sp. PS06]